MGTEVIATEENVEQPSVLEEKIIRQIEYYFGNYNLGRDKFLKEEMKKDDGWIPLEIMTRFQRLKQLSIDFAIISAALKKSPNQLMEVNEDCTKIRRKTPLPESVDKEEMKDRTLYVKGFPRDATMDQVLDFFKDQKVANVILRKHRQGDKYSFKGSVFATFETQADCDAYFEKKGIKYNKTEMIKERQKDYMKRKDEFYQTLRAEKAKKKEAGVKEEMDFPKGCILKITGLTDATIKRECIKEVLEKYGKVAFIEFMQGQTEGYVRFCEGVVPDILSQVEEEDGEKKLEVKSVKAVISLVEGEDEVKYWEKIKSTSRGIKPGFNKKGGNKGRFNKSNRNRNRNSQGRKRNGEEHKGEAEENDDEPSAKKVKADEEAAQTSKRERDDSHDEESSSKKQKTTESAEKVESGVKRERDDSHDDESSSKKLKTTESAENVKSEATE